MGHLARYLDVETQLRIVPKERKYTKHSQVDYGFLWGVFGSKKVKVKSLSCVQLFATPCPSGSSIHGILQARVLQWVAISFSRGSFQTRD